MRTNLEKCLNVRKLVEKISEFPDISLKSRQREVADLRKIHCKICRLTTSAPLRVIGLALRSDFNHATVINNLKRFDELYPLNQLLFADVYEAVLNEVKVEELELKESNEKDSFQNNKLISEYTSFLNWFRIEIHETTPVDSSFFVGKYLSNIKNN